MSALHPKADILTQPRDVRFVPEADMSLSRLRLVALCRGKYCRLHELTAANPRICRASVGVAT
jgi:hypothetical protein